MYIIIHLTYSGSNDAIYPKYKILGDLKAVEKYIKKIQWHTVSELARDSPPQNILFLISLAAYFPCRI